MPVVPAWEPWEPWVLAVLVVPALWSREVVAALVGVAAQVGASQLIADIDKVVVNPLLHLLKTRIWIGSESGLGLFASLRPFYLVIMN